MSEGPRLPHAFETLPEALVYWATRTPEATALLSPGREAVTYQGLHDAAERVASTLRALSVGRRGAVALAFPDGPELCVALLAAMSVGAAAPLAWPGPEPELRRALARSRATVVIAAAEAAEIMRRAADPALPVITFAEATSGRVASRGRHGGEPGGQAAFPEQFGDVAVILSSSGTTGAPKRIPRTHQNIASFCRDFNEARAVTSEDRGLSLARTFYSQGLHSLATTIFAGASLIVVSALDQRALPDWARAFRPTYLSTTPAALRAVVNSSSALRASSLRRVFATSAPLPAEDAERLESALGVPILNMYGLSEATAIAGDRFPRERRVPGSVGPAWCEVHTLSERGDRLGTNAIGEIVVRGPRVSPGFLDDPVLTAASFLSGGWLRTGDLGYVDENGYVHLRGRRGEIVNRGGEKIDPGEVDAVLLACPAVADAAAFAVPDPLLGEDVVAAVVLAPGAAASARQLRSWMLDRLMPYKSPRRIWFVSDVPRTANGKARRGELARRWRDEHG